MSNVRRVVQDGGGLGRQGTGGDVGIEFGTPLTIATDVNYTLDVAAISRGVLNFSSWTAGRTLTTDTAANILAAFPLLNIGETVAMQVGLVAAFAGTMAAGTGVTLRGKAAVPASGASTIYFIKTAATTVDCMVI